MKRVVITGKKRAALETVAVPRPSEHWALVKVLCAPMCTEYKAFAAGQAHPLMGHEAAGVVEAVAQPGRVRAGDRVVVMPTDACGRCQLCLAGDYIHCQVGAEIPGGRSDDLGKSAMAQYLLKQDWMLAPVPDGISLEHASMACCGLGPSFGAFQSMRLDRHDTLLITGLGPVGLGGVINARYLGARVIGVDANPYRANLALELGAEAVVNPEDESALARILALTAQGRGVDKAIDCSGVVPAHRLCIDAARRKGMVAFVGECGDDTPLRVSPDLIRKGLTLVGCWHYNLALAPLLLATIGEIGDQLDKLITHRFALDEIQSAWETQLSGQCGKALLLPWEGEHA